ncbi:MAG: aminotransferase class I/II-fold pyridoxal phosphate-dependent enzyme [Candidatus Omnitrophica bacterium]|nr:aminotransferase class I/II-fold pyridoxal phosphate-dependent enzyme [Candidatus Omnitrophota bacterium]
MPLEKLKTVIAGRLSLLEKSGALKGAEPVIARIKPASGKKGPRFILRGDKKEYIKMNSNSYLGLSLDRDVIKAEEETAAKFGAGPGSVRFINGTFKPHAELEKKLSLFHGREAAILFSSAYAAVCGTVSSLISDETAVLSDALNHNSIINAVKLSKPKEKKIYEHLNMNSMEIQIKGLKGRCRRVVIVSDGVFSMRGDYPDLKRMVSVAKEHNGGFEEGIITVIDDSHGIGAYGKTGRGTCEVTGEYGIDAVLSTLGKSLGVNGGYAVSDAKIIEYLRESAPFYIYSNPITPAEAGAAIKSLAILNSGRGRKMLSSLKETADYFREGLVETGYEIIKGIHPVVPLMLRETGKTIKLVAYLKEKGILATGLKYPVVPRGDECIRFQVNFSHTRHDIDYVLNVLAEYKKSSV